MDFWVVIGVCVIVGTSLVLIVRLYIMVHRLNTSIAKLGYVIREDAKKYFDDAANKIIDTNQQLESTFTKVVRDGTSAALEGAGVTLQKTLSDAHQEAGNIILKAREDARRIIGAARQESEKQSEQALNRSSETIRWVMEQYVGKEYTAEEHRDIIVKLLDEYINE